MRPALRIFHSDPEQPIPVVVPSRIVVGEVGCHLALQIEGVRETVYLTPAVGRQLEQDLYHQRLLGAGSC